MEKVNEIRINIRRLVELNKPSKCSQSVITDFFNREAPQEFDGAEHNPVEDDDLLDFDLTVETLTSSMSDPDNVINISDHVLSGPQLEILNRGLKFCPTPGEARMGDLRRDLDKYHRSLRLKNHLKNDTNVVTDRSSIGPFNDTSSLKLQSKSKWNPPMGSSNLETIITMNELGLQDSIPQRPKKKNISDDQAKAQKELSSNADIVIKPADKGGATVVQNRSDYVAEGLRQLSDQNYYRPLDNSLTDEHNRMVMSGVRLQKGQPGTL